MLVSSVQILYLFLEKYPEYRIINLDLLTYAGDIENERYKFIKGDICNCELVRIYFYRILYLSRFVMNGIVSLWSYAILENLIKKIWLGLCKS